MKAYLQILLWPLLAATAGAVEINQQRAQFNYQMFCQGCHTPDGTGAMSVPRMKDQVGYFLETPRGREYLVRVPGSATSALDNEELAEVLNWILVEFAGDSLSPDYQAYSADEVSRMRRQPLNEVEDYRAQLLVEIARAKTEQ
ncbi:MAG: cytochrome c, class I [Haliea sp.]|nr:cytochrome c, class I [Haliea sp.]